jgi:hypothetical protein
MMYDLRVRNVHAALPEGVDLLQKGGVHFTSRNGPVIVALGPVCTRYSDPLERVIFHADRDANPFFHFFESLWMLGGRNDVAYPAFFAKQMAAYSDDGETLHGAYGHRWTGWFMAEDVNGMPAAVDQLQTVAQMLRTDPMDRRCVVQMWDAPADLGRKGKDIPCNTQIYFSLHTGFLDMTVTCRSNDMIWGAYGANAVHFSVLQEYVAAMIGCKVGYYYQFSNNFHAYENTFEKVKGLSMQVADGFRKGTQWCPYSVGAVKPYPMFRTDMDRWRAELNMFLEEGLVLGMQEPFFRNVAQPMSRAYMAYRDKAWHLAMEHVNMIKASDWKLACAEWVLRRKQAYLHAQDDGVNYNG